MSITLPENLDLNNAEFQNVWNLIQHTRQSVFLTGRAGTGKSTFLKYICANTCKKYVVLSPTGIAAVNVGGQTLHSFFKIPFKPLLPGDPNYGPRKIRKTQRYSKDRVKLFKELELIIIDEISMVRADVIDFVDNVLRIFSGNMREPFGGKQLLFVGDIFQLEPVITRDMREILCRFYNQFFFFNARVFNHLGLIPIELRKIYRQNDSAFISLLDRVRLGHSATTDIQQLNSRYNSHYSDNDEFAITLATRRDTVDSINSAHMDALKTEQMTFIGEIEGSFPENDLPTALELELKIGAQVIFIRNDKEGRWVNGTIGKVSSFNPKITVALEDGNEYMLEPELWENMQYSYDEKKKEVVENVLGSFKQYPIKPAWALTVHKSQGLTFNKVIIDFAGGAFSSGQTYVAISRCTSLEGITLLRPLSERDIIVNTAIVMFSRQFNNQAAINDAINLEKANELYRRAAHAFDHFEYTTAVECFAQAMAIKDVLQTPVAQRLIVRRMNRFKKLSDTIKEKDAEINRQATTLKELAAEYVEMGRQSMSYGGIGVTAKSGRGAKKRAKIDEITIKSSLANFNKALRIAPGYVDAMIGKAQIYAVIDEFKLACQEYKKCIEIDEKSFDAHYGLATLYRANKDVENALRYFKKATKIDKKQIGPHQALAEIYEAIGLDDLAEQHAAIVTRLLEAQQKKQKRAKK